MFDVGFFELALIGVIALLVVGPERLPKLARTIGAWIKRVRNFVGSVQQDIEKEIQAEELKKALQEAKSQQEQLQASLNDTHNQMNLSEVTESTRQAVTDIKQETVIPNTTQTDTKQAETK